MSLKYKPASVPQHIYVKWLFVQAAATGQSAVGCGWSKPMMEHAPPALLHFPGSRPTINQPMSVGSPFGTVPVFQPIRHRLAAPASRRERRGWKHKGVVGGLRRGWRRASVVEAVRIAGDHRTPRGRGAERVSPQLHCLGKKVLETAGSCPSLRRHPPPATGPRSFTHTAKQPPFNTPAPTRATPSPPLNPPDSPDFVVGSFKSQVFNISLHTCRKPGHVLTKS